MFEPARRWRVLAAVGLVLALAQAPTWGQESVWTKATNLTCRVGNLPRDLIRKPRPAAQPRAPIFAWEKKDATESEFAVATFLETIRDYKCAYFCYRTLSRRYPAREAFAAAAARAKAKYLVAQSYPAGTPGYGLTTHLDDQPNWLNPAEPQAPDGISSAAPLFAGAACPDAQINNPPFALCVLEGRKSAGLVEGSLTWESLAASLTPPLPPLFLLTFPSKSDSTATTLPERKDMLPDTDRSQLLSELGVIAGPSELLAIRVTSGTFLGFGWQP